MKNKLELMEILIRYNFEITNLNASIEKEEKELLKSNERKNYVVSQIKEVETELLELMKKQPQTYYQ